MRLLTRVTVLAVREKKAIAVRSLCTSNLLLSLKQQRSSITLTTRRRHSKTSCARGDTKCPRPLYAGHCSSDAVAELQPIHYACGAQHACFQ